jgi:hypothetical protein
VDGDVTVWYQSQGQYGIRAKVSTLSLDGPVELSLDRGFEEKLCLETNFGPLSAPECQGDYLTVLKAQKV